MKSVIIDFPVVAWSSTEVKVPDEWDEYDIRQAIENDDLEVPFDPDKLEAVVPVIDLEAFIRGEIDNTEIPIRLTVTD